MAATAADTPVVRTSARTMTATDWGMFIVRIFLGVVFLIHGSQKVLGGPGGVLETLLGGQGLSATATGMGGMGIPVWLAYVSIFTEFAGGILLILGVLSRICGIGLFINMAVAIWLVHLPKGFFGPFGYEYPLTLAGMALAIIVGGPGAAAIADWEGKLFRRSP